MTRNVAEKTQIPAKPGKTRENEIMNRIRVNGDQFYAGEEPFFARGFNYIPSNAPGADPQGGDWSVLCRYDAAVIEREIAGIADCGGNALRVWLAYADEHWTASHTLTDCARRNLGHFLDTCAAHGIYVNVTVGGSGTLWGARRGLGDVFMTTPARVYTEPVIEDAFLADVRTLIEAGELGTRPNILGIDLANEPIFGIPRTKASIDGSTAAWRPGSGDFNGSLRIPGVAAAWEAWSREHTGAVLPIPNDLDFLAPDGRKELAAHYQCFVHDCFCRHARRCAGAIRARWPESLITIGFGCGGTGAEFAGGSPRETFHTLTLTQNIREMQDGLDFVCIHRYDDTTLDHLHFLRDFLGSERPVLIQEFGHIPGEIDAASSEESAADQADQLAHWQTIMEGAHRFNYAGFMGCNYNDFSNPEPVRNTWCRMGITNRDGRDKPACELFRSLARSSTPVTAYRPQPLPYTPANYRHSVHAFGEMYAVWRKSRGRLLFLESQFPI